MSPPLAVMSPGLPAASNTPTSLIVVCLRPMPCRCHQCHAVVTNAKVLSSVPGCCHQCHAIVTTVWALLLTCHYQGNVDPC
ncbi:hypothetical protein Pmani_034791 [Petrolisthes manimaculis]|uniref:Uncharacterized protein n=1 Tax=Petrolisthes manimaculis TaxID=1843537 RepID=A0AAE1NNL5_9EUCA|nr:hypothetical protein Pmani_034791 [Petrolisthes manimaculis]